MEAYPTHPMMSPQTPRSGTRMFGIPLCWIFFAIGTVPIIVAILTLATMLLDESSAGPGGATYLFLFMGIAAYVWPFGWGFAITGLVTALQRMSMIKRYNRVHNASERGEISAMVCAASCAVEAAVPFLLLALFTIESMGSYVGSYALYSMMA